MPRKTRIPAIERSQVPVASMRPRPDAAENVIATLHARGRGLCFNEAAARCRGKRKSFAVFLIAGPLLQ